MDLRVQKTRENIRSHFLQLLRTCPFQEITVKQLIQECRINRSTFYRNYEDKYDLLEPVSYTHLDVYKRQRQTTAKHRNF